jgi:hypothetical protein
MKAVIWRRGIYFPCWQVVADRKYRLALQAAATKSALRAPGGPIPQYKMLYYKLLCHVPLVALAALRRSTRFLSTQRACWRAE